MFIKINHIKEIKVGDTIRWFDRMGFEQRAKVFAADDGQKCIKNSYFDGTPLENYPVSLLINTFSDTVEIVRDDSCHICGCEGGH